MATFRELFDAPKEIASAQFRQKSNGGHRGINVRLKCDIEGSLSAVVRVNLTLVENFSCILVFEHDGIAAIDVLRVNGDHGEHRNPDGQLINGPHVHLPTDIDVSAFALGRPSFGIAIDRRCALLPFAWQEFCSRVNIAPHEAMASAVSRLHSALSQESFDDPLFDR